MTKVQPSRDQISDNSLQQERAPVSGVAKEGTMDLSDVSAGAARKTPISADADDAQRWRELISTIGAEIAGPLSAALERINALITSGRIDRVGLRALRDEV